MKKFFEKNDLIKIIGIVIFITLILTWIIPSGTFSSTTLTAARTRLGITDFTLSGIYSLNFFLQQIFYIFVVGAFYGIISKTEGYQALIARVTKALKGKEIIFLLLTSLVFAGLTSVITSAYVLLIFVPLFVTIILNLKLDKITAFAATFGSILIGILGATYGTEGLTGFVYYLSYYTTVTIENSILIRFGIFALTYVLFNFFVVQHAMKILKNKKFASETEEDMFKVEETKKKKAKIWPLVITFVLILVFTILGYIEWSNFDIDVFDNFHTWLTGLSIGDHAIFSYLIGANGAAFGSWSVYTIISVIGILLIINIFIYKVKLDDLISTAAEGMKKITRPLFVIILVYIVFVFLYLSPFVPSIVNWIISFADGFNPFLTTICAMISSIFHVDFSYTGYVVGSLLATYSTADFNVAFTIYSVMNGFMGFIAPTSVFLVLGLSYLNIPYKNWMKYIWKFVVGLLVVLLVIFALLTYL